MIAASNLTDEQKAKVTDSTAFVRYFYWTVRENNPDVRSGPRGTGQEGRFVLDGESHLGTRSTVIYQIRQKDDGVVTWERDARYALSSRITNYEETQHIHDRFKQLTVAGLKNVRRILEART